MGFSEKLQLLSYFGHFLTIFNPKLMIFSPISTLGGIESILEGGGRLESGRVWNGLGDAVVVDVLKRYKISTKFEGK